MDLSIRLAITSSFDGTHGPFINQARLIREEKKGKIEGRGDVPLTVNNVIKLRFGECIYIYAYIYVGSCLVNSCVNTAVLCVRFCTLRGFRSKSTFPPARRVTFKLKSRNVVKRSARDTAERV